jgi:hypothetical protein
LSLVTNAAAAWLRLQADTNADGVIDWDEAVAALEPLLSKVWQAQQAGKPEYEHWCELQWDTHHTLKKHSDGVTRKEATFYMNKMTGESTWEKPKVTHHQEPRGFFWDAVATQTALAKALFPGVLPVVSFAVVVAPTRVPPFCLAVPLEVLDRHQSIEEAKKTRAASLPPTLDVMLQGFFERAAEVNSMVKDKGVLKFGVQSKKTLTLDQFWNVSSHATCHNC